MANLGKEFENQIRDSITKIPWLYYLRLPDPPQAFNQNGGSGLRFSNKNPYDFLMYKYPFLYTIENKSKATNSLSFTLDDKLKNKDIKAHQIKGLYKSFTNGAISGFLINFREDEETYFIHIVDFLKFVADTTKKSINKSDIKEYKGILIPQTKKIKKFNFDIEFLMNECESRYEEYGQQISKNIINNKENVEK